MGNLTFGGTGKTPFLDRILTDLEKETSIRLGVISRGYGRKTSDPRKVEICEKGPQLFGEETYWLKQKHPQVPMAVAIRRLEAAQLIENEVDLILTDDGFQHWSLKKDLSLVLVDVSKGLSDLALFPLGRGREPTLALHRAQYVIFSKANWNEKNLLVLEKWMALHFPSIRTCRVDYVPSGFLDSQGQSHSLESLQGKRILLVTGIANPQSVENLLPAHPIVVAAHIKFKDHHSYTEKDGIHILSQAEALHVDEIVTTEKDLIKLKAVASLTRRILALRLELVPHKGYGELLEKIISLAR